MNDYHTKMMHWFDTDVYVDFTMKRTPEGTLWIAYDIGNPADTKEICRSRSFMQCVKNAYEIRKKKKTDPAQT